ncbi:spermatogenesis-associated protein 17 [Geranomyces variabilis]|nr:spermatogenesis-associated protein 17 [Geranomyces variabilis]
MALSFARIWPRKGVDIVDQFFLMASDAELHRDAEYNAAIVIQKAWRGFVVRNRLENLNMAATAIQRYHRGYRGRQLLEELIIARNTARRMAYYFDMAVRIQRIWRGYWTRAHVFNYYERKAYIQAVKQKAWPQPVYVPEMEELREHLADHLVHQEQEQRTYIASLAAQKADRLAGTRHHLLGTKDVPGIYSGAIGQRRTVTGAVRDSHGSVENLLDEDPAAATAEAAAPAHVKTGTLPPLYIPESSLRDNSALRAWIRDHVGVRNYRGPPLSGDADVNFGTSVRLLGEDGGEAARSAKRSQGPFMPERQLQRVLSRPLRPSLRVETGFLDTKLAQMEERRLRENFRVSDQIFKVVPRVKHAHPHYYSEPIVSRATVGLKRPVA